MLSLRDCVVQPAGVDVPITKSVADNGRERIEPDRFLILMQSAIELAAVAERVTQPDMPQGRIGIDFQSALSFFEHPFAIPFKDLFRHTKKAMGFRVAFV